ncbi:MAG: helix-turn-helix transcriptional regulator [Marinibacterium sp.]|nr:helix-turn-helix transcriptional regulator [Marinibacterium sp.]
MHLDNHIKALRRARGWTQKDLADRLSVSRQTVIAIENGRYDPSLPLAFAIASVFGQRIEEIFFEVETP